VIIDAWMQHTSAEFLREPMFDSLRRWSHGKLADGQIRAEATPSPRWPAGIRAGSLASLHGNAERVFALAGA
jgi:hypothetical protein